MLRLKRFLKRKNNGKNVKKENYLTFSGKKRQVNYIIDVKDGVVEDLTGLFNAARYRRESLRFQDLCH